MSYEMRVQIRRATPSFPFALVTANGVGGQLQAGLGELATVLSVAEALDHVVVAYEASGDDHFPTHESVLNSVGYFLGQFAYAAFRAEVQQLIRYGLQAGGGAAAGALGATAKQRAEVKFWAGLLAFFGGYLFGELVPIRQTILTAEWNPHNGWVWTNVPPPEPLWSVKRIG